MDKDIYLESIEFAIFAKRHSTYEIKELNHPFVNKIPKHLYKYRKSGEEGRKAFYLGDRNIYTASFDKLHDDDALEGVTPIVKERIKNNNAESICRYYKQHIISILREKVPSLDLEKSSLIFDAIIDEHFDFDFIYKRICYLVKDEEKKALKTATSAIAYMFRNLDNQANENKDFKKGIEMFLNINELMGAYCVCDTMSNDQLWSLYADRYAGYCIEYDLTDPCKSKGSIKLISGLYPVIYAKKKDDDWFKMLYEAIVKTINIRGKASQFDSGIFFHHWLVKTLCTKKESWSYEREWRILGNANKSYKGPLISSIIVGHKINKTDFEEIQRYASVLQCKLKITDFDFEKQEVIARDITDNDISLINKRS